MSAISIREELSEELVRLVNYLSGLETNMEVYVFGSFLWKSEPDDVDVLFIGTLSPSHIGHIRENFPRIHLSPKLDGRLVENKALLWKTGSDRIHRIVPSPDILLRENELLREELKALRKKSKDEPEIGDYGWAGYGY